MADSKLMSLQTAVAWREKMRAEGKKVSLTNGVFDLLHAGHLTSIRNARKHGDALVMLINSDASVRALKGPGRPIQNQETRAEMLSQLEDVDAIVIFSSERLVAEIEALKPDAYCKAGDYTLETMHQGERAALEKCGAQIFFTPFLKGVSTTTFIQSVMTKEHAKSDL